MGRAAGRTGGIFRTACQRQIGNRLFSSESPRRKLGLKKGNVTYYDCEPRGNTKGWAEERREASSSWNNFVYYTPSLTSSPCMWAYLLGYVRNRPCPCFRGLAPRPVRVRTAQRFFAAPTRVRNFVSIPVQKSANAPSTLLPRTYLTYFFLQVFIVGRVFRGCGARRTRNLYSNSKCDDRFCWTADYQKLYCVVSRNPFVTIFCAPIDCVKLLGPANVKCVEKSERFA